MYPLYIALGSNLGDRRAYLRDALQQLHLAFGAPTAVSGVYQTAAWGVTDQPDYLNMVAAYQCDEVPLRILRTLQKIEAAAGRVRHERWGSRTLDLDLLSYGAYQLSTPTLTLPHPRIAVRNFVLAPLAEIAPALILPGLRKSVAELYAASSDPLAVRLVEGVEDLGA